MKNYLYIFVALTLTVSSAMAEADPRSEIKDMIKNIKTVDDVKEVRNAIINRMTEIYNSGKLEQKTAMMLKERIIKLSNKPLPTQEQIDWRSENPIDISTIMFLKKIHQLRNSSTN